MTPAQKRLAQQMQQMQQNNAYERMRADRLAARMPARGSPVQAPRPTGQASKMMGVIRRANGGPVNGLPTLEELANPAFELTAPAFGGMTQSTYDWMAPYVTSAGATTELVQPQRGAPAQTTFASSYIPGMSFGTTTAPVQPQPQQPYPLQPPININPPAVNLPPIVNPVTQTPVPITRPVTQAPVDMPASTAQQMYSPGELGVVYERGSFNDMFSNIVGRAPTADETAQYSGMMAQGATANDISQAIRNSSAYLDQPLLDRSTGRVGYTPGQQLNMEGYQVTATGSGLPIKQVTAAHVSNILADLLGGTPDFALVNEVFGKVGSSAKNWQDLSGQVVKALTTGQTSGTQTQQQQYSAGLGSLLRENPQATIGDIRDYAQANVGGAQPTTTSRPATTTTAPAAKPATTTTAAKPAAAPAAPKTAFTSSSRQAVPEGFYQTISYDSKGNRVYTYTPR